MALVLADRVKETTTTTSTGTITLAGTSTGYQSFSVIGNGNTTYYAIVHQTANEWEVGIGTYTSAGTTLARTTVLASSNSGSLVNFSSGTKDVFVTYPAERSVNLSSAALTSGRVPYATTDGLLVDSANLTFNGTTLSLTGNQVISVTDNTNAALRVTQTGTGNSLLIEDSANPDSTPFVIDQNGRVVSGYTTPISLQASAYLGQFLGSGNNYPLAAGYTGASTTGSKFTLAKNRSADWSTQTIVQSGDTLGEVDFMGSDGTNIIPAARIGSYVDGTPGTNDMPGRLVFSTTADGASSPTERMRIDSSGNVGIGTTSLSAKLTVYGAGSTASNPSTSASLGSTLAVQDSAGSSGNGGMVMFGASQGFFAAIKGYITNGGNNTVGDLIFATRNATTDSTLTERMRIDSSGNVGIGKTPSYKLDVAGTGYFTSSSTSLYASSTGSADTIVGYAGTGVVVLSCVGRASDNSSQIRFLNNAFSSALSSITETGTSNLTFTTAGSERMRIDSSGNVGIGTSSPANKLDVIGGRISSRAASTTTDVLVEAQVSDYWSGTTYTGTAIRQYGASQTGTTVGLSNAGLGVLQFQNITAGLIYTNNVTPMVFGTNNTERMRIDSSGNVGIGTNSPSKLLHLYSTGNNAYTRYVYSGSGSYFEVGQGGDSIAYVWNATNTAMLFGTNNTERMRIDSSGNVGIGTTSPSYKLDVSGTGRFTSTIDCVTSTAAAYGLRIIADAANTYAGIQFTNNPVTSSFGYYRMPSSSVHAWYDSSASEKMRIDSSGNVGIGTSSPAGKLNVSDGTVIGEINPYSASSGCYIGTRSNHAILFEVNASEKARIDTSGNLTCAGVYSATVGATNRDVYVDNTGLIGYVSSIRASKTEIQNLADVSWLNQLNPVSFKYRKKDEDGNYTDETDGDIQYGMIAEDVEQVRPDLCFYDEVDGEQELRGIQYSKLVPVMLKAIQELNAEIAALKAKLN